MPAHSQPSNKKITAAERAALVYQYYVIESKPRAEVAKLAGCTERTVSKIAAKLATAARERLDNLVDFHILTQLERLDDVYSEALAEWERSKKPRKITKQTTTALFDRKTGQPLGQQAQELEEIVEERDADIKYLGEARKALEDARILLGIRRDPLGGMLGRAAQQAGPGGVVHAAFREVVVNMEPGPGHVPPAVVVDVVEVE